jgi:5-methylcytosine-specific restriction endonuclease McrA
MIATAHTHPPQHHPGIQSSVLALNRQYSPVHVISVRRAFCLLYKGVAEVVSLEDGGFQSYDFGSWLECSLLRLELDGDGDVDDWIRAVNFAIQVPRVVRLLKYERLPRNTVKFNRRNIFLRDEYVCQYCGRRYTSHRLSLDHVLPRSRGGPTSWENIVCCCLDCNVRKGGRTPPEAGMKLIKLPRKPARNPILFHHMHTTKYASWKPFLADVG